MNSAQSSYVILRGSIKIISMFIDRMDAGQKLAAALIDLQDRSDQLVVLAIPRGGVIVAHEVARSFHAPLDVILARKLSAPNEPELAIGAVAEDGQTIYLDQALLEYLHVPSSYLETEIDRQKVEMQRRASIYRRGRNRIEVANKIVVVVDDGVATGATLIAALRSIRNAHASELIAAIPVGPNIVIRRIRHETDRLVCLEMPIDFWAVGQYYEHFRQVSDEEVVDAMNN
jgi:putative phosphoribosyl transferase